MASPCWAQTAVPGPTAAEQCLTPSSETRGLPDYPGDLVARKDGGVVHLELIFTAPDSAPGVRVIDQNLDRRLMDSVRDHVSRFRVPCLAAGGEPVRLRQQYVFVPDGSGRRIVSRLKDIDDERRAALRKCVTRVDSDKRPLYPQWARQSDQQGKYLVKLRFATPDRPPETEFLAGERHMALRSSIEHFAAGYRLPCVGQKPEELTLLFQFSMEGGERTVLRDVPLVSLLRGARQPLPAGYFEFDRMGCPFELRLTYWQPHMLNEVAELDAAHAERQHFIDWLRGLTLDLSPLKNTAVLGDHLTVSVPCGKLDL